MLEFLAKIFGKVASAPLLSVNNFNFTLDFFKAALHANPGAERLFTGFKW